MNKTLSVLFLSVLCTLTGFGTEQACTKQLVASQMVASQMPVRCVSSFLAGEREQAVLSAFRQNETGENRTTQEAVKQSGNETTENASVPDETVQEQKTVSGNTIDETEIVRNGELDKALEQVNQARKEVGLGELVWNDELADAAAIRAEEICKIFSHTRPDGSEWWSVNENVVYGENLAKGYQNADSVMKAWLASAEHKDNILYSGFTTIGIAVYESDGKWYWAQEFGY